MSLGSESVPFTMPVEPAYSGGNNGSNGGWGGDGAWWIIILFLFVFCGWGGNGWGNGFGGGNGAGAQGALTRADLCSEFNFNGLESAVRGVQQGICDGFYAMQNSINGIGTAVMQGVNTIGNAICNSEYQNAQLINGVNANMMNGFNAANIVALQNQNALQTQLADCCCKNQTGQMQIQNAIEGATCSTGRAIERGFCDTNYNQATNTTAIIQNAHNDTDRVLAKLDAMEMSRKDETIAALRQQLQNADFRASQADQNNYLVNTLRPCPIPSYSTCNPWAAQAPYGTCGTC